MHAQREAFFLFKRIVFRHFADIQRHKITGDIVIFRTLRVFCQTDAVGNDQTEREMIFDKLIRIEIQK